MSFKDLNLDRGKIEDAIQEWAGLKEKIEPVKKGNGYHYTVPKDGSEILLIIYQNKNGTVSLNPNAGKNPALSNELAEYIKEKCLITKRTNFSLSFRNVNTEDFLLLLEFLAELEAIILDDNNVDGRRIMHVKGPFNDEITVIYHGNKTVQVQGKPLNLYVEIKLFFYEILSFDQVVQTEAETYEIDIKTEDIRNELEQYLPIAFSFLDERIKKIITPSLTLMKLEMELEDYSSFAFPALRGLEGYMRQLLSWKGKEDGVKRINNINKLFREDAYKVSRLQNFAVDDIRCDETCQALEKIYNFWKPLRHPFFHTESRVQMTPIIWKKEDAEAILNETLVLIEDTYSKIALK